jgi:hypothetical protein
MTTTDQKTVEKYPVLSSLRLQEQVSDVIEAYASMVLDDGTGSSWRFEPAKKAALIAMWRITRSIGMMDFSPYASPEYPASCGVIDAAVRRLLALDIDLPLTDIERERLRND